jgi:hypothetical protein
VLGMLAAAGIAWSWRTAQKMHSMHTDDLKVALDT